MNVYDRIINILLESRIEGYLERLDEGNAANKAAKRALMAARGGGDVRKGRAETLKADRKNRKRLHPEGQHNISGLAKFRKSNDPEDTKQAKRKFKIRLGLLGRSKRKASPQLP